MKLPLVCLLFFWSSVQAEHTKVDPKIALKCGKPIFYKYLSEDRWVQDSKTFDSCVTDEHELTDIVFRLCKTFYPNFETETISEVTARDSIPQFCDRSEECVGHQFICHKGDFVARSLPVPQDCTFGDRVAETCMTENSLKLLAQHECETQMTQPFVLHDYGILPPACENEVDKFTGVEYVCCPPSQVNMNENKRRLEEYQQSQSSICKMPPESGPCFASLPSWYFNAKLGACFMFNYGGCQGNENRFTSKQRCLDTCGELASNVLPVQDQSTPSDTEYHSSDFQQKSQNRFLVDDDIIPMSSGSGNPQLTESEQSSQPEEVQSNGRVADVYLDLPYLLGGEPKAWFKAKIDDMAYLSEDFVIPENVNEHQAYTSALVKLEDSYEEQMSRLMHDYESAERSYVQSVQSAQNAQLTDAFQRQLVQLYESATRDLEDQYKDVKTRLTQKHRARVSQHKQEKLQKVLRSVQLLLETSDENYLKEPALMSAVTKYLDLEQDIMSDEENHFQRIAALSYSRASVEHRQIVDNVYAAHDQGVQLSQAVLQLDHLSFNFKSQLDIVMGEFDDYFDKILANIKDVTKTIGVESWERASTDTGSSSDTMFPTEYFFNNLPRQNPNTQDLTKVEIEQSGVFPSKYVDKMPGVMKNEMYEKASNDREQQGSSSRQKVTLIAFACLFGAAVLATVIIAVLRKRHRICTNRTFIRVDSSPHPLSPEDKHINSLQVNGYYNPIYKFFDDPQET